MARKGHEQAPSRKLADWQWVEKVLAHRVQGKTSGQVAEAVGMSASSLTGEIRRIRWMAHKATLGNGCPFGTTERKVAQELIAVWDKYAPRRTGYRPYVPMTPEVGKAVSDAIRKVEYAASGGTISRIAGGG